jgi:hypothetical protein
MKKPLPVFFDTEFTSLDANAELISIGLIAASGQEFYAELAVDPSKFSAFAIETVFPLLDGSSPMTFSELAVSLKKWIESMKGEVVLISDAIKLDWPFIYDLFEKLGYPKNMKQGEPITFWVPKDNEKIFDQALEDYWLEHSAQRHHALVDARSLYYAWNRARTNQTP